VASGTEHDLAAARWLLAGLGSQGLVPGGESALLIFDQAWNTPTTKGQRGFAAWARGLPGTIGAFTIEYPNVSDRGRPVEPAGARAFGAAVADLIATFAAGGGPAAPPPASDELAAR